MVGLQKAWILIKSNLKKSYSQVITVAILILIASTLLNMLLILSIDYTDNFKRLENETNSSDVIFVCLNEGTNVTLNNDLNNDSNVITNILDNNPDVKNYSINKGYIFSGSVDYDNGKLSKIFTVYDYESVIKRTQDKFLIVEEILTLEQCVYLPYSFKAAAGYRTGDYVNMEIQGYEVSLLIAGFYNNPLSGTPNTVDHAFVLKNFNFSLLSMMLRQCVTITIQVEDGIEPLSVESAISEKINCIDDSFYIFDSSYADKTFNARYTASSLCTAVESVSSIVVIFVTLLVIAITLSNYVRNNIRNMGTLKALGYTSGKLIAPLILEFVIIGLFMSILGIGLSYIIFPFLNNSLEALTGVPYNVRFLILPCIITIAVICLVVVLSVYFSVRKIKRIDAIQAIRVTSMKNNKKTNVLPLNKANLPLNLSLSIKNIITHLGRSFILFFTMLGVSLLIGFASYLFVNAILHNDNTLKVLLGDIYDVRIEVDENNKSKLNDYLNTSDEVKGYYTCEFYSISHIGGERLTAFIFEEFTYYKEEDIIVSGHLPSNENEVSINFMYGEDHNLSIGDKIKTSYKDGEAEYIISGFHQNATDCGTDCFLLLSGFEKMYDLSEYVYCVKTNDGVDNNEFIKSLYNNTSFTMITAVNYASLVNAVSGSYIKLLFYMVVVVCIISLLITGFVLYILISINLNNSRKEHGILKSLGFVTKDIINQTILSFVPVSALAIIVGLISSRWLSSWLLGLAIKKMGVLTFGKMIGVLPISLCIIFMILLVFIFAVILSARVRKIEAHDLFNNE